MQHSLALTEGEIEHTGQCGQSRVDNQSITTSTSGPFSRVATQSAHTHVHFPHQFYPHPPVQCSSGNFFHANGLKSINQSPMALTTKFTENANSCMGTGLSLSCISYFKWPHFLKNSNSLEKVSFRQYYRQINPYFSNASRNKRTTLKLKERCPCTT